MPWDPEKYHQFQSQRSEPFDDLLKLVDIRPGLRVVDLGCGTGELTRRLADSLPQSDVLGVDSSPQMLERAGEYTRPGLQFKLGNQAELDGVWGLIFSNAALQWSENHEKLIPFLFNCLAPGGQITVQVPSNHNSKARLAIIDVAGREPFVRKLDGWTRQSPVLPIETYAELLFREGAQEIIVFEKVYPHVLENADAVVDWISGTALVPYFERLGDLQDDFVTVIRRDLRALIHRTNRFSIRSSARSFLPGNLHNMGEEGPTQQSELVARVGTFLFLLGIFSLIFFVASDFAKKPDFDWLFVGMVLLGFGFLLRRRAPPAPPTGRFGVVRRYNEERKKRKEERAKKVKKK